MLGDSITSSGIKRFRSVRVRTSVGSELNNLGESAAGEQMLAETWKLVTMKIGSVGINLLDPSQTKLPGAKSLINNEGSDCVYVFFCECEFLMKQSV